MLIDTHCHLSDKRYEDPDAIVAAMQSDGLEQVISIGYDLLSSTVSRDLAARHERVFFAAGIHPGETAGLPQDYTAQIRSLAADKKCVAIGEIGLDYHYPDYDAGLQKKILCEQLALCAETGLPAIFHVREADGEMLQLVREHLDELPARGVVHCFSGSKETALAYVQMGFYISFTGSITFKNAVRAPEILAALPRDRVLVETDSPYLSPVPFRGETNFPARVRLVARRIAEIWGIDEQEVAKQTTQNAYACFPKLYEFGARG